MWKRRKGKTWFHRKILPICKFNLFAEDDVTKKWKVMSIELIFHAVSRNVVIFDSAPWEGATFTDLYWKSQKWTFWNIFIFFFVPWHAAILIAPNVDSYFGIMQKHQVWSPEGNPINRCCAHLHDLLFWRNWWRHGQWLINYPYEKPPTFCDIWWKFEDDCNSDASSGSSYMWVVKQFFLETGFLNWVSFFFNFIFCALFFKSAKRI